MLMFLFMLALPTVAMGQQLLVTSLKPYNITATQLYFTLDTNINGNIDRHEIDESFLDYDRDGNGRVSRSEYTSYVDTHSPNLHNVHDALFNIYDVDKDHILEEHDYDNFYKLMDGNGDGFVSHFEFVRYWEILLPDLEKLITK